MGAWFWVGLATAAVLVLVPAAMLATIALRILMAWIGHRRSEQRGRTVVVGELGPMTSTGDGWWTGVVDDLDVSFHAVNAGDGDGHGDGDGDGGEPGSAALARVRAALDCREELERVAREHLEQERHRPDELSGLVIDADGGLVLSFLDGADELGMLEVHLRDRRVIGVSRMA